MSVITIPSVPAAPESLELTIVNPVSMTRSPFTGQQQVFNWGSLWFEASVTMPAMRYSDFSNWIAFIKNLQGPTNTFQFTAAFVAAYPLVLEGGSPLAALFWRLKSPSTKYSLTGQRVFGLHFEIIQAI